MMSREAAKIDAENAIRTMPWLVPLTPDEEQTMTCTNRTGNAETGKVYPAIHNGDAYADYTDNPHAPVIRRVGEPDSKWLVDNGHGPFEPVTVSRPEEDPVNHPRHYSDAGGHEPIKVIEAWDLGFCLGNTVKYIARAGKKDPNKTIEDLKKAAWYLARHIENLENDR